MVGLTEAVEFAEDGQNLLGGQGWIDVYVEDRNVLVIVQWDCDVVDAARVRLLVMNGMLIGKKLVLEDNQSAT